MPQSWMGTAVLYVLPGILVLLGLYMLVRGLLRILARRPVRGSLRLAWGLILVLTGALIGSIGLNLRSYHRLTQEQQLCQIWFSAVGPQDYAAEIHYPDGRFRSVQLKGDAWQLDARVLKWKGYATVLGLDTRYRLERITGRYRDVSQERSAPHSVYALSEDESFNLLRILGRHPDWAPWVDATYGSATYLPMADGARYSVTLGTGGLLARPVNPPAEQAVRNWE